MIAPAEALAEVEIVFKGAVADAEKLAVLATFVESVDDGLLEAVLLSVADEFGMAVDTAAVGSAVGLDPRMLQRLAGRVESADFSPSLDKLRDGWTRALREAAALHLAWAGATESAVEEMVRALRTPRGIDGEVRQEALVPPPAARSTTVGSVRSQRQMRRAVASVGEEVASMPRMLLEACRERAVADNDEERVRAARTLLVRWSPGPRPAVPVTVKLADIPSGKRLRSAHRALRVGTLRPIECEVHLRGPADRITTSTQVYGARRPGDPFAAARRAVRVLADEGATELRERPFQARLRFLDGQSGHTGRSADLAVATLVYTSLLDMADLRERYRLRSGLALSGRLSPSGDVLPVHADGLRAKVEAAFFSPYDIMVVPLEQAEAAGREVDRLNQSYPHRSLVVISVAHVREVFFDRRLTDHVVETHTRRALRRAWHSRYRWATLSLLALATLLAVRIAHGPFDARPDRIAYDDGALVVLNLGGERLETIGGHAAPKEHWRALAALHDVDGDGVREVLWADCKAGTCSTLRCKDVGADSLLWERALFQAWDFPYKPDVVDSTLTIVDLHVGDFNADGDTDVAVIANLFGYFPSVLTILDAASGEALGAYAHVGHLYDMEVADIDGDGREELMAVGVNQALRQSALLVLDPDSVRGHGPTADPYGLGGEWAPASEQAYVLVPRTKVGRVFRFDRKFGYAWRLHVSPGTRTIRVTVADMYGQGRLKGHEIGGLLLRTGGYHFEAFFNFDLRPAGFGTYDDHDLLAEALTEAGHIDAPPDVAYFEAFRDSIRFWTGEDWASGWTLWQERAGR